MPEILRFRIGRRVRHGLPGYEQLPQPAFEVILLLEFAGPGRAEAIPAAPAHGALGHLFETATSEAAAYDYQIVDARDAAGLWSDRA